jgi:hypothetical protein
MEDIKVSDEIKIKVALELLQIALKYGVPATIKIVQYLNKDSISTKDVEELLKIKSPQEILEEVRAKA